MVRVAPIILNALDDPCSCTLAQLAKEYELLGHSKLQACSELEVILSEFKMELAPPIGELGWDDTRILRRIANSDNLKTSVERALKRGEGPKIEFKGSIAIDLKYMANAPGRKISDYVSKKLKLKAAKEICAFMNTSGGQIFFGIADDHSVLGCEHDFRAYPLGGSPGDKADLLIKEIVFQYFREADSVFHHLRVSCCKYDNKPVVILDVSRREQLTFLKNADPALLYLRSGTNCQPVPFEKIEQYFRLQPRA